MSSRSSATDPVAPYWRLLSREQNLGQMDKFPFMFAGG
jgi:hypothetical protein